MASRLHRLSPDQTSLSVTAIILTYNAADLLANCIETLQWCDEIIVVDNDSTDESAELAESLGARVIRFKSSDFSKKREMGLKRVKTDWVFYIDADERVTPTLYREIAVHLETSDAEALRLKRQNICYGFEFKHGGWEEDYVTRIFSRDAISGWKGSIHESPVFEGRELTLHTPLLHLTHQSTEDNLRKSARWTKVEAQLLYDAKTEPVTLLTLIRKGVMEFIRRAYFKQGYKDGMPGLVEALVQGMNRIMVYIQVWEMQQVPSVEERYQNKESEIVNQWKQIT